MSLQGSLVIVAEQPSRDLAEALCAAGSFPVVDATTDNGPEAIIAAKPGAILLADAAASRDEKLAAWLSEEITALVPIVPVIACAPDD